jgi:hypothetical protein
LGVAAGAFGDVAVFKIEDHGFDHRDNLMKYFTLINTCTHATVLNGIGLLQPIYAVLGSTRGF